MRARWAIVAGGVGAVVALFLLVRPTGEDEPAPSPPAPATTVSGTPSPTAVPTTTATPAAVEVEAEFEDGRVTQAPEGGRVAVERGTTVRIEVRADVSDEVHVHGYDHRAGVAPDAAAVIEFVADVSGVFEVELEGRAVLLFHLEVGA